MDKTTDREDSSIIQQLRQALKDALDYGASLLTLLQARATDFALSGLVFVLLIMLGGLMAIAALALLSVALGVWLTQITGSAAVSLLIMAVLYGLLGCVCGWIALRWLNRLKS